MILDTVEPVVINTGILFRPQVSAYNNKTYNQILCNATPYLIIQGVRKVWTHSKVKYFSK